MSDLAIHPWFSSHSLRLENIVWHWRQASSDEMERGMLWYAEAQRVAIAIAHGDAHLGAGMIAIYSPQQWWTSNILIAARVLRDGRGVGGPASGVFASTAQRRAADRLLAGERYEGVLTGPKVRDFAHLIEHGGDRDPDDRRVVIDRHALSVVCGRGLTVEEYGAAPLNGYRRKDGSINRRNYDHVASFYRQAAQGISRHAGRCVAPYQVQAVTWLVRQRLNQHAQQARGQSVLDKGRAAHRNQLVRNWQDFRATNFPDLDTCPGTGYLAA